MTDAAATLRLQRLFQLASPSLPVGGFAYSEGLETAVHEGAVTSAAQTGDWIGGVLDHGMAALDLPVFFRLHAAWSREDAADVAAWSAYLTAARETAERRAQERHVGAALAGLLADLGFDAAAPWCQGGEHARITTFATMIALAARGWAIGATEAAGALVWAWLESQVLAAVKLVPLGQTAGQRLLIDLGARVPDALDAAADMPDSAIAGALPGAALMSARHEVLYSRLFRS